MKIRTQLAVALLLLAIVPMSAIVLYNYISSERAVREAVEAEAATLTADMENRVKEVRGEIRRRVQRIGGLPFRKMVMEEETEAVREALYESLVAELGETANLVDSFEFVPEFPRPEIGGKREPPATLTHPAPPGAGHPMPPMVIDMRKMRKTIETAIENLRSDVLPEGTDKEDLIEHARRGLEEVEARAHAVGAEFERAIELRTHGLEDHEGELEAKEERRSRTDASRLELEEQLLLVGEVEVPVYEGEAMVGEIRAQIRHEELLRRVLERTRRERGEIPFAIDTQNRIFAIKDADKEQLEQLGLGDEPTDKAATRVLENWVVVTSGDPRTGLTLGIARPIRESLSEIRSTALRNFSFGAGLIGLALLGVLPLSRRMTKGLNLVAEGAERVARGDLAARVEIDSQNEIGQLASSFNHMAQDLEENQRKLIEGERERREQEVRQELLQAEYERKTEELEEARRFQLSLLPRELPQHDSFEVAAMMKTATEVGGDYYDFRLGDDGSLIAAIGDATGHGAKAGTMVTVVKSLFSAYPPDGGLADFQTQASATIKRMALGRMSMALTLVRLTDRTLTVSAAGMPPVLLHRASSGKVEEVSVEGMPLGSLDFTYRERSVQLNSGDTVLLMSDGFPELPNEDGDALTYERAGRCFGDAAKATPDGIIEKLTQTADAWTGSSPADDITFVVLRSR